MNLTIVLTNFRRPQNIPIILEKLAKQNVEHQLFVWDNSPEQTLDVPQADWLVRSSRNAQCVARWWLAAHAETPWVVVMDDDLVPTDTQVFADTIAILTKHAPKAIGVAGVILDPLKAYIDCCHLGLENRPVEVDTLVHIIKGRYFAVATELVRTLPWMPLNSEDDIIASSVIGGGIVAANLQRRFKELPCGTESRFGRPNHLAAREATRRNYFSV